MRILSSLMLAALSLAVMTGCPNGYPTKKYTLPDTQPQAAEQTTPAPPPPLTELFLTPPGDTTIRVGKTERVFVRVERRHFKGPVTITFDHLPDGVSVIEAHRNLTVETDEAEVMLQALPSAGLTQGHEIVVTASRPDDLQSRGTFRLNVMQ